MVIAEDGESPAPRATFERRSLADIAFEPNPLAYAQVRSVSENLDRMYAQFVSPWVRLMASPQSAGLLAGMHPMRLSRKMWSGQLNPFMHAAPAMRAVARSLALDPDERGASAWFAVERVFCTMVRDALAASREIRDQQAELVFDQLYGSKLFPAPNSMKQQGCGRQG